MPECFPPAAGESAKVLILGSMPGRASLEKRQYYAHPRNQFWRLLGAALGEDLASLPYEGRLEALARRGVALWDVFARCERPGSLDADISEADANDVPKLIREKGVRAVFCNGGTAWNAYRQQFEERVPSGTEAFALPSSSPAHAGKTLEEKLPSWMKITEYLK